MISELTERIQKLEQRVAELERLAKINALESISAKSAPSPNQDTFSPNKLQAPWANKEIRKDPPKWTGESFVGKTYSQAPAEWHMSNAGFYEWKAMKGKEENPPRLQSNGKPWYESDLFTAKLSRTWASQPTRISPKETHEDIPF